MNDCESTPYAKSKSFYLMLTPTLLDATTSEEKAKYEALLSDFTVSFKSRLQLDPTKRWVMSLMEATLPLDKRFLRDYQSLRGLGEHWFAYSHGFTSVCSFQGKHYFHSSRDSTVLESFSRALGELRINNPLSLVEIKSMIDVEVVKNDEIEEGKYVGNTLIRLKQELPSRCGVHLRISAGLYDLLFGKSLVFKTYRNSKLIGESECRWSIGKGLAIGKIISNEGLKEGTELIAVRKGSL